MFNEETSLDAHSALLGLYHRCMEDNDIDLIRDHG